MVWRRARELEPIRSLGWSLQRGPGQRPWSGGQPSPSDIGYANGSIDYSCGLKPNYWRNERKCFLPHCAFFLDMLVVDGTGGTASPPLRYVTALYCQSMVACLDKRVCVRYKRVREGVLE